MFLLIALKQIKQLQKGTSKGGENEFFYFHFLLSVALIQKLVGQISTTYFSVMSSNHKSKILFILLIQPRISLVSSLLSGIFCTATKFRIPAC